MFKTKFENSGGTETVTYEEGIDYFKTIAETFPTVEFRQAGPTDCGEPLSLIMYSADRIFDPAAIKNNGKLILLINNGIHPGEPDGIDASMLLLRDLAEGKIPESVTQNVVVAIIPFYNIGGALNRNSTSRVNQAGPNAYGFRGNGRNYDLNRDFIKCDTRNARSFSEIFHYLDPDLFLDTHVSNGADYQYTMTLVYPQKDKLGEPLKSLQEDILLPYLFEKMSESGDEMTPYVNLWGTVHRHPTPEMGIEQFPDYPRYSTGYTALFNTIGFMTETHMLKPFSERVESTYRFMETLLKAGAGFKNQIISGRQKAKEHQSEKAIFPIKWSVDPEMSDTIVFRGFESEYIESEVTGTERLRYDRTKPFAKAIPYFNTYKEDLLVNKPEFYIIPQSWHNVIDLLTLNGIKMDRLESDTVLTVEKYHIRNYKSVQRPYEGHFIHYDIEVDKSVGDMKFRKGDYKVQVNQAGNRYIVETLEPQAEDSFFKWNFFDPILQRKEHYSAYVFEDLAAELLRRDDTLRREFENKKTKDQEFARSARAQLDFIYKRSGHAEEAYLLYPVFRSMPGY